MKKNDKKTRKHEERRTIVPVGAVIMVVGGGGREHALVWKIAQSPSVRKIYCAPGNAGTAKFRKCRNIDVPADDMWQLLELAKKVKPNLVVFGGETLLADGAADIFKNAGFEVFGPTLEGAMMEASKEYAKDIMRLGKIKTAKYKVFTNPERAENYIREVQLEGVIKADGLTGGKGVSVYRSLAEAKEAINDMMVKKIYKDQGEKVLVEKRLHGKERSLLFFTDGKTALFCPLVEDYKQIFGGDRGLNTGGMGGDSPPNGVTGEEERKMKVVGLQLLRAMRKAGINYRGIVYIGFMIVKGVPYVLEINCRFGDPECQPIMRRMKSDLVPMMFACAQGTLDCHQIEWDEKPAVCVVLSSRGYPGTPDDGKIVTGLNRAAHMKDVVVFYAGAAKRGKEVVTKGGRNFGPTALGFNKYGAATKAYAAARAIEYEGKHYRKDIANRR